MSDLEKEDENWNTREGLLKKMEETDGRIAGVKDNDPVDEDLLALLENARDAMTKQLQQMDAAPQDVTDGALDIQKVLDGVAEHCHSLEDWNMALMAESNAWAEAGMPPVQQFNSGAAVQEASQIYALTGLLVDKGILNEDEVAVRKAKEYMKALLTIRSQYQDAMKKQKMRELLDLGSVEKKLMGPNGQPLN